MIKFTAFTISILLHLVLITSLALPDGKTSDSKSILLKLKSAAPVEDVQKELPAEVESKSPEQIKKTRADIPKPVVDAQTTISEINKSVKIESSVKSDMEFSIDTPRLKTEKSKKIRNTTNSEPQNESPNITPAPDIDSIKHAYEQSILKKIDSAKSYPALAVKRGKEGRVKVDFIVHSNGDISELKISYKASFSAFNDAAIKAVNAATPFDPVPPELKISQMKISVWVSFKIGV